MRKEVENKKIILPPGISRFMGDWVFEDEITELGYKIEKFINKNFDKR